MRKISNYVLAFLLLFGCGKEENTVIVTGIDDEFSVKLDTVFIQPSRSSQVGRFEWTGSEVLYIDHLYGFIESYSPEGNFIKRELRTLQGPEELASISSVSAHEYGFTVKGEGWTFYEYDKEWKFQRKYTVYADAAYEVDQLIQNPVASSTMMYELQHYNDHFPVSGDYFYAKVDCEHPTFNAFINPSFYKEAFLVAKISRRDGKMEELLYHFPETYQQYRFVPFHIFFDFHVGSSGKHWLTFEIDPTIYVYDASKSLVSTFGVPGVNMRTSYPETRTLDVAFDTDLYRQSRFKDGFYKDIFVDEEANLVFRTYRTGTNNQTIGEESENPLRLQIYEAEQLVSDIAVPGKFRLIGKVADRRYIADGFYDETAEKQGFYVLSF
ncbi:hypothetical protein [Mongoliitalea lutea]|uniref:Uncharacterized protein n=1 Tax=Mongoliitalea lutea TaxID=849756 RepID=A0A8J3G877_9BACT|nr:hypothetical protein [Mongoliitalea lutea]GHB54061.1 hypothetical protein GCM10008106_37810 [Mongoliitalea lutea]